jgi:hypothetical protein
MRTAVTAAVTAASSGAATRDGAAHGAVLAAADKAVRGPAADLLRAFGEDLPLDEARHVLQFALPDVLCALPAVPMCGRGGAETAALWHLFDAGVPVGGSSSIAVVNSGRVISAVTMTAVTLPARAWLANAHAMLGGGTPTALAGGVSCRAGRRLTARAA